MGGGGGGDVYRTKKGHLTQSWEFGERFLKEERSELNPEEWMAHTSRGMYGQEWENESMGTDDLLLKGNYDK